MDGSQAQASNTIGVTKNGSLPSPLQPGRISFDFVRKKTRARKSALNSPPKAPNIQTKDGEAHPSARPDEENDPA